MEKTTEDFVFRFRLTESEYSAAHRAHLRRSLFTVKNLFLVTTALAIGAVQAQLFGGAEWALRVFAGLWCAIVFLVLFVYVRMPGQIYRRHPGMSGEQEIRVDDQGAEWIIDGISKRLSWEEITKASDDPDSIYLHSHHGLPWILPKSVFRSEEQLRAFDQFVARKLWGG